MSNKLLLTAVATITLITISVIGVNGSVAQSAVGITGNAQATGISPGNTSAGAGSTATATSPYGLPLSGSSSSSSASSYGAIAYTSGGAATGNGLAGMGQAGASVFVTPGGTFSNSTAGANNNGLGSSTATTKSDGIYSNGVGYGVTNASGSFNTTGIGF